MGSNSEVSFYVSGLLSDPVLRHLIELNPKYYAPPTTVVSHLNDLKA